jgi:LCP family protein required for cell wall assembly
VVLVATLVAGLLAAYGYLQWRVGQIERIAVSALTPGAPPGGPTWLVVGSDSREGLDPNRPDAGGLISDSLFGQRSDAIILVRDVPDVGVQMLSLPRDLWFDPPGDGNATRINAAYNEGANSLVALIQQELGVDIHRYVEVDLAGLDDIVDAAGGITVQILHPGHDASIGLRIAESGDVHLDGATALGYVRTRHWTEVVDGRDVLDGTGDIGRNTRQQSVLGALGRKLGSMRNPVSLNAAAAGITSSVRADGGAGVGDLYHFARMLQRADQSAPLPVVPHITGGGASVLLLTGGSDEVLAPFRAR